MQEKYKIFVSPNEILSVKSFGLTLFDITVLVNEFINYNLMLETDAE